nr:hypothetical protein [Tanacetum cinerariifolium]
VNTPRSDEDRLKLMELMVFLKQRNVCVEIGINAARLIVITEEVVREILQLNDAEGVICLLNEEIFAGLARMGYEKPSTKLTFYKAFFSTQWKFFIHTILHSLSTKRTSWNEFSSAMASAMICLSSCQRYISPALIQKVFTNMRRVGKGFSGVETPLFEKEVVTEVVSPTPTLPSPPSPVIPSSPPHQQPCPPQPQDEKVSSLLFQRVLDTCSTLARRVEGLENDKAAQQLEIVKLKARVKKLEKINMGRIIADIDQDEGIELVADQEKDAEVEGRHADKQAKLYNLDLDHSSKVLSMQEDDTEVQEAVEIITTAKLMTEVVIAAATQAVAASTPILAAKPKILNIADAPAVSTRRRKGVVIRYPEEELPSDTAVETPKVKDKGKGILIEAPKPIKKKDQIEMDAEYARKLQEEINKEHEETYKNIDWNASLDHSREEMEEEDEEIIKSINETPAQKAAKRRKLHAQAKKDEDLKKQLEVVDDEDDDVFIEATPIGRKVPVVDYKIVMINNKPRYKIIKADGTHQLYTSFITLLNNFDREDLEDL